MNAKPITKTQELISKYNSGDFIGAVKILSSFRIGITKEQKRVLEIAKDCNSGSDGFYRQLGLDVESIIAKAKDILDNYICVCYGCKRIED